MTLTFTVYDSDLDAARREAVRLAHEAVFSDGRTAEVSTALVGRHGGAYVDGDEVTVRFT
jgi:hypothetical protein